MLAFQPAVLLALALAGSVQALSHGGGVRPARHHALAHREAEAAPEVTAAATVPEVNIFERATRQGRRSRRSSCRARPSSSAASVHSSAAASSAAASAPSAIVNVGGVPSLSVTLGVNPVPTTHTEAPTTTKAAPTTSAPAPKPTTTEAPAPAPKPTTETPAPAPKPTTTAAPKPAPPTSTPAPAPAPTTAASPPSSGGYVPAVGPQSYLVGTQSGDATFYATGLGACGITNTDTDYIAAVSHLMFDTWPGWNGANPNNNPICGKKIRANYNGNDVTITVTDRCTGCAITDLDFSPSAFSQLADQGLGRLHEMKWNWIP